MRHAPWDLNYRGNLVFLDQARAQETARALQIEDGWTYFIYGWTRVIAEVFHVDIPVRGPEFDAINRIAVQAGTRLTHLRINACISTSSS